MADAVSEIEIRVVRPDEFEDVGTLTLGVYVGEGYISPESTYVEDLADTAARVRVAQVLVAVGAGVVLGSLTLARPGTPYAAIAGSEELEFRMLAVDKRARGSGTGTALVRHVIDTARAEGYTAVVLATMDSMVEARRIYDRLGFVRAPERDRLTSKGDPLIVMRMAIDT